MNELTPGKRYRWTLEGTAKVDPILGGLSITDGTPGGTWHLSEIAAHGTIELLLDPLPTTPGSVVRTSHGKTYVLLATEDGLWPWLNIAVEDDFVAVDYFKADTTVLFDAGAERA